MLVELCLSSRMTLPGIIAAVLLCASSAFAGAFQEAVAAYDRNDYATALLLFRPLAEDDSALAEFYLGIMYHDGLGIQKDGTEAAYWMRKSAEHGVNSAQFFLGVMYENVDGVRQDYVLAHMWFNLAAAGDDSLKQRRDELAAKMTPEQIAEAQRLAREWTPTK
jgi:uncharacterized protein